MCSYSIQHHGAAVGEALRTLAPGAALVGTSCMMGLVVESNWKEPDGAFIALQASTCQYNDAPNVFTNAFTQRYQCMLIMMIT